MSEYVEEEVDDVNHDIDDVFGFAKAINTDVLDKMSTEELKELEEMLKEV